MKKQELLNYVNDELLDRLFGFCYSRTNDSHQAEELCSDIVYALVKAAHTDGEIESAYPFIWRVARNVYADFSEKKRKRTDTFYSGDPETVLLNVAEEEHVDDTNELLTSVYRRIAFLTKAYRDVMIMFYLDGLSSAEIAKKQGTSEGAIRQRLFSARQKIKSEVEEMSDTYNKPISLDENINYVIWGTGNPSWGDPRDGFERTFSKHILWLCRKKAMSASEIAEELNVPTVYVEEELEILRKGENGEYGLLRRLDNGKYTINFVLLEKEVLEKATAIYNDQLPMICDSIAKFFEEHRDEYLAFPYLNKSVDINLIYWQQIHSISHAFSRSVHKFLTTDHFTGTAKVRPFSVFGYVDNGKLYGGGWDGIGAENICGYSKVHFDNIYIARIKKHFSCGHDISNDPLLQLAIRAIDGLDINTLTETEKEHSAKAIECGYLYRDGDMLYTKILACKLNDRDDLFKVSHGLDKGVFDAHAKTVADKLALLFKKSIPEHLLDEWEHANNLANLPILDAVVEHLIEKGILTPPENGIGAEGCWMSVNK